MINAKFAICEKGGYIKATEDSKGGMHLTAVKCENCGRTLAELEEKLRIKCRKCGHMNYIVIKADQASQG